MDNGRPEPMRVSVRGMPTFVSSGGAAQPGSSSATETLQVPQGSGWVSRVFQGTSNLMANPCYGRGAPADALCGKGSGRSGQVIAHPASQAAHPLGSR